MEDAITVLTRDEAEEIGRVINRAAEKYRGVIPDACFTDPYMPMDELIEEMDKMSFYGYRPGSLVGVIGLQPLDEVFLIRHLYVLPSRQRDGIGSSLLEFGLRRSTKEEIWVGTWADATWAIEFYEQNGFESLGSDAELLDRYWDIPADQRDASVVLRRANSPE